MHTLFGMQTKRPYFADAKDASHEPESRQALISAGAHMICIQYRVRVADRVAAQAGANVGPVARDGASCTPSMQNDA